MSTLINPRRLGSWLPIGVAAVLSVGLAGTSLASVSASPGIGAVAQTVCAADPTASADAAERFVTACRLDLARQAQRPDVVTCLRGAGSTPDSIERWLSACVTLHP